MKIYPYKQGSKSAKALAEALGVKRIKHDGAKPARCETLLNWGASVWKRDIQLYGAMRVLNFPDAIVLASNKLKAFKVFKDAEAPIPHPLWTDSRIEASRWLAEGVVNTIVCRTKLNGHSGEGIVLASTQEELVDAPLYTAYIPKKEEYRLHVHNGQVFFVQRKARNREIPNDKVNWQIRNHGNGFIYAHKDIPELGPGANEAAIMAVRALGLDFGAVDLIFGVDRRWYVLEVNTACGLEGTTLEKYVEQFKQYV